MVGGTLGDLLGFEAHGAEPERAPLRRARRRRHRRRARHRPRLRAAARRARRRASSSTTSAARSAGEGADAEPADDRRRRDRRRRRGAVADTNDVVHRPRAPQALVDAAVERFGRIDILVNNAGIMRWARFPELDDGRPRAPPRRARRRVVPHRPRRVAAHGRAGLRPHRDDHVGRACSGCPTTPPTPPPRAASSA